MTLRLDAYAARSCPVKTFNRFDPTLEQPEVPPDESLREKFAGGLEFRSEATAALLAANPDALDLREMRAGSRAEAAAATLEAMRAGTRLIVGAQLPSTEHRMGGADLLLRGGDAQGGQAGYHPVRIKPYKVLEVAAGATSLRTSPVDQLGIRDVLADRRYRMHREAVLLELAHAYRMLEACGHAPAAPWAGVISGDSGPTITWVDLSEKFIRTFSRTSANGYKLRSALERYDHEFNFRVHVATQAQLRTGHDDPPPPVRPIRVRECESCLWWETCRPRMDDDDISLRISKTPLDVRELQTLLSLGVRTATELAEADIEALLPHYVPLTRHRDRSEQRLRQAARRARMLAEGVSLERINDEPITVPRAPIEVDLDIETAEGGLTYLWGALLTDRRTGQQTYQHFSGFADLTPHQEVALAADFARWLLDLVAREEDVKVFHYSDYETVHLRRLAERSGEPALLAAVELIPDHFVDLFGPVRDNFVGIDGLGLKMVATQGPGFQWRDEEPGGLASQLWFQTAVEQANTPEGVAAKRRVLEYNEDDVRATWAVREWMASFTR